jgi:hypothetical protein
MGPVLLLWISAARRFAVLESSIFAIAAISALVSVPLGLWLGSIENVQAGWAGFLTAWLALWLSRLGVRSLRPAREPWRKHLGWIVAFGAIVVGLLVVQVKHVNVSHVLQSRAMRIPEARTLPQFGGRLGKRQSGFAWSYSGGSDKQEAVVLVLNEIPCSAIEIRSSELAKRVSATGQHTTVQLGLRATFDRITSIRPMAIGSWKVPDGGVPGSIETACDPGCACLEIGERVSAMKRSP